MKNNLHTIVSLLESQSAYLGEDALVAVRDSQHRVYAMSLIHQKLYLSENVTSVNMAVYVKELVSYLKDSFNVGGQIRFQVVIEFKEKERNHYVLGLPTWKEDAEDILNWINTH